MAIDVITIEALARIVGKEHLLTAPEDLVAYSYDATPHTHRPEAVAIPGSTAEVAAILKLANEANFPVVPRGSGTNLSGGTVPVRGGIVLLTKRLDRILEIDEENLVAVAQPGVILAHFHKAVEARRLFYPPDPASMTVATLGGNIGEGSGGPRGAKYGTTKDWVIGLEVVLPTGDVIRTGGKTMKNVSGYNLTPLFIGSEGTLGVITEITLRLIPLPEATKTCLAIFDSLEGAAEAVSAIIKGKIVPTTLELLDDVCIYHIEAYRPCGLPLDAEAVLLIEVDGAPAEVERQTVQVVAACQESGAREVKVAQSEQEAEKLWAARRSTLAALARARPSTILEDATVPRAAVPQMIRAIKGAARRHNLEVGLFAHAADGNAHPQIMCDASDPDEMHRVEQFTQEVFKAALELGGTLSGEHGIGLSKAPYLAWQFSEEELALMRGIKRLFDPKDILNPGKIFPIKDDEAGF